MFESIEKRNIQDYIRSNHGKITVKPGLCRFNYRCHNNAAHDAIEADDESLAMCVYFEDNDPVIHFINIRNGEYIDNTLGHWSKFMEYYLIRTISKDEFFEVLDIFTSYRNFLKRMQPLHIRLLSKYYC